MNAARVEDPSFGKLAAEIRDLSTTLIDEVEMNVRERRSPISIATKLLNSRTDGTKDSVCLRTNYSHFSSDIRIRDPNVRAP